MSIFVSDKQTQEDLTLLGKYKQHSIFSLFNRTLTAGGERFLEQLFIKPLQDVEAIRNRNELLRFFQEHPFSFPVSAEDLAATSQYLGGSAGGTLLMSFAQTAKRLFLHRLSNQEEWTWCQRGQAATLRILQQVQCFLQEIQQTAPTPFWQEVPEKLTSLFQDMPWETWVKDNAPRAYSLAQSAQLDHLLRNKLRGDLSLLIQWLYTLDAYISIAQVGKEKEFHYGEVLPADQQLLSIEEGYHPMVPKAVANSYHLDAQQNLIFLTGANMAGKSTYMKTFGILVYLAHMGFPLPCKSMKFSVKEGLYTSINVPDNLEMGYSHFYAEVLRVKQIAQAVATPQNLVVVFDELFKGTNVKDAFDATLAITEALSQHKNCFFLISTHIVEVGDALKAQQAPTQFVYMPTIMDGKIPRYTYRAQSGISSDRHGMRIIENEGILSILEPGIKPAH